MEQNRIARARERAEAQRRREIAERFRLPAAAQDAKETHQTPFDRHVAGMDEHDFAKSSADASLDTNINVAERSDQAADLSSWLAHAIFVEQTVGGKRYGHPPPEAR